MEVDAPPVPPAVPARPIRLVVEDDLRRNRLTVFFRLLLAIPHLVWLYLWGLAFFIVLVINWFAVLFVARVPEELHNFAARYVRYATHVSAYLYLAANPYPGFLGRPGYPVDLEIAPPVRQSRWSAGFRLILILPALLLAALLGAGFTLAAMGAFYSFIVVMVTGGGVAVMAAVLTWFASLVLGRAPRGLRDLTAAAFGYATQTAGYLFLLTGRYPSSDPALADEYAELPEHPVQAVVSDDLRRPRLTVLFRLLLTIPHLVWISLWGIAAFFAAVAAWIVALVTGRTPTALHRFLAAYVRYAFHVLSYLLLLGRRFPGFTGRAGSYGLDLEIAPPARQNRWKTLFRLVLALPAAFLANALTNVAYLIAFFGWFFALVMGRMPEGLRNLGVSCLRYSAQLWAYVLVLTDRYPYAAPVLEGRPSEPEAPLYAPPSPPPPPPRPYEPLEGTL